MCGIAGVLDPAGRLGEPGASRTEAARLGSVSLQIIRDWLLRFNAPLPAGLIDRKAPAPRPRLSDRHRAALAQALGPAAASCAGRGRHRGVQKNLPRGAGRHRAGAAPRR
jgi:hypothetical protein